MEALKLLFAFSPWLAFWIISSGGTMTWLKVAVIVSSVMVAAMGVARLHRGLVLWVGVAFFAFCLAGVVWLENMWVVRHMGVIASGTLFASTFIAMLSGRPFTRDYVREHVPPELWESKGFERACYVTTGAWCAVFFLNTSLNAVKLFLPHAGEWLFRGLELGCLLAGVWFTTWYAARSRRRREAVAG